MASSPSSSPFIPCICPTYEHPLMRVVQDGIDIKCRHCKQVHHISRELLEQRWNELAKTQQETAPAEQ